MINKQKLLNYLISNGGKPDNLTWYEVGVKFGVEPPNTFRAATDKKYERDGIKKATIHIWKTYLSKSIDDVELVIPKESKPFIRKYKKKRLFFDIETSYNIVKGVWKTGYNLSVQPEQIIRERAIICVSYSWDGDDTIHTIYWENGDDKNLIKEFVPILESADEVIGHNIDRFDIKWVRTRALFHQIPMSFNIPSTDTLKIAKKYFYLNSNKLDYVATIVGVDNKLKHRGISMWDDIILHNDKDALREMGEYCEQDILVTKNVFHKLQPYFEPKINYGALISDNKNTCPNCGSSTARLIKTTTTKIGTLKREVECGDCAQHFIVSDRPYNKLTIIE